MNSLKEKAVAVLDLMRFSKQYGTLLLFMPTLWSLVLAEEGLPSIKLLFIFIVGSFLTRSAGCVINDYADVEFDKHVERTKVRPLASGRLSRKDALIVFTLLMLICLFLVLQTNMLTVLLSPVAIFLMVLYPFVKRYANIPQIFLGAAFGWGAVMAWAAAKGEVALIPLLIFFATIFWATAYDTVYALMDIEDDLKIGVKSTAILFGRFCWLAVGIFYTLLVVTLIIIGKISGLALPFYLSLLVVALLFLYHVSRIKNNPDNNELFSIFKANVWVGLIVFFGIVAGVVF